MNEWKSIHIFYHDINKKELVLCNIIEPLINKLIKEGKLSRWFFINYWEGGPHLRLRMENIENSAFIEITDMIKAFIDSNPSSLIVTREQYYRNSKFDGEAVNIDELPWYEDGTVKEVTYIPEIDRYGGELAIGLAESLFMKSSNISSFIIKKTINNFNLRFSVAIDLFIHALHKVGCLNTQYLKLYSAWWGNYLGNKRPVINENIKGIIEKKLKQASEHVQNYEIVGEWGDSILKYFGDLKGLNIHDGLACNILSSQLHMMNNRLAVTPEYEYIISEGILLNLSL